LGGVDGVLALHVSHELKIYKIITGVKRERRAP
jgi:hypothetical protein